MSETYAIADARTQLGDLVRRAGQHEHITLTDRGTPTAMLISCAEYEDLEDSLALARRELQRTRGHNPDPVPHDEARQTLMKAAGLTEDDL